MCGADCRRRRRNRQARARRSTDIAAARQEERERQQRCRSARAKQWAACSLQSEIVASRGAGQAYCHEPASRFKSRISQKKVMEMVDRARRLSRASFEVGLQAFSAELGRFCARQGDESWQRLVGVTS